MKYVHQFQVTKVSPIAIDARLTVPLPTGAEEIHGTCMALIMGVSRCESFPKLEDRTILEFSGCIVSPWKAGAD